MAWNPIADTDRDTNSPIDEDLVGDIVGNIRELRQDLVAHEYAEASTTSATFVSLTSSDKEMLIPDVDDYTGIQRTYSCIIEGRVSTDTGSFRLRESVSGNTGGTVTTTNASYEDLTLTINVDAAWAGSLRTFEIQAHRGTGGTVFSRVVNRRAGELKY